MKKHAVWILIFAFSLITMLSCATIATGEQAIPHTVDELLESYGFVRFPATMPVAYHTADSWHAESLALIESAEEYILISVFLGNYYSVTQEVWDALRAKVESGVAVYCIIDSASNFQTKPQESTIVPSAFTYLRKIGIQVVEYNPFSLNQFAFIPTLFDRDHRKFWIIDGKTIALGGTNINYSSLGEPVGSENIDSMVVLHSPKAIEAMIHSFVDTWNRYSPNALRAEDFAVPSYADTESSLYLIDHKWPEQSETTLLFDALLQGTEEELWMVQSYSYLTGALKQRIKDATDRGVAVHVIVSENAGKRNYQQAIYHSLVDLIDAGATVYMFEAPNEVFLHLKLFVADERYTVFGSPNYNFRSQTLSRELAVLYDDAAIAHDALAHIDTLLQHCRVVDREEAKRLRTFSSLFYHLLMQVYG